MNANVIRRPKVWKAIKLPNGEQIITANRYVDEAELTRYDTNHNIYRLNAQGEVVWQVQRDEEERPYLIKEMRAYEQGKLADLYRTDPDFEDKLKRLPPYFTEEYLHEHECSGLSLPFMYIHAKHPDGTIDNLKPDSRMPPDVGYWKPGDTVCASALDGFEYVIDIETGLATNISPLGGRPW